MKLRKKNLHRLLAAETGDAEDLLGLGRSTTGKGSRTRSGWVAVWPGGGT
jgi:hypothetical protein